MVVGLVLLVCWYGYELTGKFRLAPPAGVTTLKEFAEVMPPPRRLAVAPGEEGSWHIVWTGELSGAMAGGPSCYVFDQRGQLVFWVWAVGTAEDDLPDQAIGGEWVSRTSGQPQITVVEALAMVGRK
jgi:hypothetical protein